ncbi:NUDIX domain-containing protein [Candidatus Nomurabacteria bacterium]|nr:NUDIX domain-containing protein [Candidatus Nomurabacteria bacterium]
MSKEIQPCVGAMIWKGDKILLGKRCGKHAPGEYSFPGGRIDYMESLTEAIQRETEEESGIKIKNIRFQCVANIDRYSYRHDLLVCFLADYDSGEVRTDPDERIGDWDWYSLDNLPDPIFLPTSILIDSYKTGKNFYDKE